MNSFTIAQMAQYSGIKPHTIRMWEHRYEALSPTRSQGNTRIYSNSDLKRLLNIVGLVDSGHKVAELGKMDDVALNALVRELYELDNPKNLSPFIFQLLAAGMEFDESSFQKTLSHCLLRFGMDITYKMVIYPLLNRMGLMWSADLLPPAKEHFMSNLLRQKLFTAIDSLPAPKPESEKWLLFLPEDEYHEIGLLMAHYLLRKNGINTLYLGSSVPLPTLESAIESANPDCLLLFLVHRDLPENSNLYISEVRKRFPEGRIYISGNKALIGQVQLTKDIQWLRKVEDLEDRFTSTNVKQILK